MERPVKNRLSKLHVFFDDSIFHIQPVGGISRYVTNLALALAATDQCRVTLFAGWSAVKLPCSLRGKPNLQVVHLPRPPAWRINTFAASISLAWRRLAFRHAFRRCGENLYHPTFYTHDPVIARHANAMVVTFHDMIAELFPEDSERAIKHRWQKVAASREANAILTISDSTFNDLVRLHPWTVGKTSVAHLATEFRYSEHPTSIKWNQQMAGYFLMVGNRDHYKNGHLAILAFKEFSQQPRKDAFGLVICGGKPPTEVEVEVLKGGGLDSRVVWVTANDEDLASLYSHATALLYPSRYEGFGLPVLEAMACGCPVITTRSSSLPEVGGDACVYINGDDHREMAGAMRRLTSDIVFRRGIANKGVQRSSNFSWQKCAKETMGAYTRALRLRKSRPTPNGAAPTVN